MATMVKMMISVKEGFYLDESEYEETRQQWERVGEVGRQTGDQGDRTLEMYHQVDEEYGKGGCDFKDLEQTLM